MNTFFIFSQLSTAVTKCCTAIVCLVVVSAPIITIPGHAFAEEALQDNQLIEPSSLPADTSSTSTTSTVPADSEQVQTTQIDSATSLNPDTSGTTAPSVIPEPESINAPTSSDPVTSDGQILESQSAIAVANNLDSEAVTGNTSVIGTSSAGALTTGDAVASTTTVSVVQSSLGLSEGQQPLVFTLDIVGDTNGDILIDPSALDATPMGTALASEMVDVSNSTEASITNNISLTAVSGDVLAADNRIVGNIQSGDASVVANVLNLLNSAISANQSFIGTINILGNLNGDILIPAEFISGLIASGQAIPIQLDTGSTVNSSSTVSITNNILSAAITGNVLVQDNSLTGDISTGNSQTSVNIINLIGMQAISKNTLLIFVNVLGTWTGLLFNAPAGTTTTAISGGVGNTANQSGLNTVNQSSAMTIVNNITLLAQTGNASAIGNKNTGTISTGNASTGANVLNIVNSQLNFSDWFGILFINVFGVWNGSLAAATEPVPEPTEPGGIEAASAGPPQVFSFVAANTIQPRRVVRTVPVYQNYQDGAASTQAIASASTVAVPKDIALVAQDKIPPTQNGESTLLLLGGLLLVAGIIGTRYYSNRSTAN